MLSRVTRNENNSRILVCGFVALFNTLYFLHKYNVITNINDVFYDADAARTLTYASDPKNAISSIRPLLYGISWFPHLISKLVSPFVAWVILNSICLIVIIWLTNKTIANSFTQYLCITFLFVNFSTLSWTIVPDTFLLGATFFMLAIEVYGDGSKRWRVIGSGIIATGLNLFLIVPWTIAHIFLSRKEIVKGMIRLIEVGLILIIMAIVTQYAFRFKPESSVKLTETILKTSETQVLLPSSSQTGVIDSVSSLGWLHSPLLGTLKNLIMFLGSPWTVSYHYTPATAAIDSVFFPIFVLVIASGLSLVSFSGLFQMRSIFPRFFVFFVGLEIGTLLLFLTYGFHPVLYSPFLLVSRISGLSFFLFNRGKLFYQFFFAVNIVTFSSIYLVF